MKSRRLRIIVVILFCWLIGGYVILRNAQNTDTIAARLSNLVFENNPVELKCIGVDRSQVEITWHAQELAAVIFKKGEKISSIGQEYGPNAFDIWIGKTILHAGHWKFANWHSHDYLIKLVKVDSSYFLTFIADGPDFEHTEEQYDLNGKRTGRSRSYFRNGKLSVDRFYQNGWCEGNVIFYYENGNPRVRETYVGGKLHGEAVYYKTDGSIESVKNYGNRK